MQQYFDSQHPREIFGTISKSCQQILTVMNREFLNFQQLLLLQRFDDITSTSVLGSFKREISKAFANFAHYNDFNLLTVNFAAILAIFQVSKLCTTFAGQELCCHLSIEYQGESIFTDQAVGLSLVSEQSLLKPFFDLKHSRGTMAN